MKKEISLESKTDKIKKALSDVALSSTCHGLPNIVESEKILLKIMWLLFFLISFSYCCFQIFQSFQSYLNWEYVTNIDIIQESLMEFPAITICNLNPFVTDFGLDIMKNIFNLSPQNWSIFDVNKMLTDSNGFTILIHTFIMGSNFTDENRKNLSLPLENILIGCNYGLSNCSTEEFEWRFNMFYGNCYTFNSGRNSKGKDLPIRQSSQAGNLNGLTLQLYLGNQSKVSELTMSSGVHVFVHNRSVIPNYYEGVDVSSGELTNVVISKSVDMRLEYPYNDCHSNLNNPDAYDSEIFRAIINSNQTYSQEKCFDGCFQMHIIENCSCYNPFSVKLNCSNICDDTTEVFCALGIFEYFYKQDVKKMCSPYCPLECDRITYSLSISHSEFPTPKYGEFLKKQPSIQSLFKNSQISKNDTSSGERNSFTIDNNEFKNSIAAIRIYYEDLKYTNINQIPKMSFSDLLANIGGQLGLFIGISFLSFIEILDAFFRVIFILMEKNTNSVNPF